MLEIKPVDTVHCTVEAPPSKSYTNRALLIAALAEGESRLVNPLYSDDTRYMQAALEQYGVPVTRDGRDLIVRGQGGVLRAPNGEIYTGNAGTAMRFLASLAALAPGVSRLNGDVRMQERPIEDLLVALRAIGVEARSMRGNQCPPLTVRGGYVQGGTLNLSGEKSSQFLSSLLLSSPYFKHDTTIKIIDDLTSKSYVDITLDIMKTFGVHAENEKYMQFRVRAGQRYKPQIYTIEGDASSASYFFAAAAVTGGEVVVTGINPYSAQGDIGFPKLLEQMGCEVNITESGIRVKGNPLHGINISMNRMPDVVQTLAVVALFASGPTDIGEIGNLRIKETDRILALQMELSKLGARVTPFDDGITIHPPSPERLQSAVIETYHDHRMAMSFAVAGLKIPGIKIKNPDCVKKSFPDFFDRFKGFYE